MPKVNLYPPARSWPPDASGADRRIEMGWSQNTVQIGTTLLQPGADRHTDYFTVDGGYPAKKCWEGAFVDLDRESINQLIKMLRDCRDNAFGADQ